MSCQGHPARQTEGVGKRCSCHTAWRGCAVAECCCKQMLQCVCAAACYKRVEAGADVHSAAKLTSLMSSSDADASASSSLIQSGA